jgi:hypothetical protein
MRLAESLFRATLSIFGTRRQLSAALRIISCLRGLGPSFYEVLDDLVSRMLYPLSFAVRTTAWPGKPFSLVKHIIAYKALGWDYDQSVTL